MLDLPIPPATVVASVEHDGRTVRFVAGERRGLPWPVLDDLLSSDVIGGAFDRFPEVVARRGGGFIWLVASSRLITLNAQFRIAVGPGLALIAAECAGIDAIVWQRLHAAAWMQAMASDLDADAGRAA